MLRQLSVADQPASAGCCHAGGSMSEKKQGEEPKKAAKSAA
jgi:hypothetical protein